MILGRAAFTQTTKSATMPVAATEASSNPQHEPWHAFRSAMTRHLPLLGCVLVACCSTQAHTVADVTRYHNQRDVEALLGCLGDQNAEVRGFAAGILGETSQTKATQALAARAVPTLAGLLKDPDPRVRKQAAKALGDFRDPRAIPALMEAVRGPEAEQVPGLAALALGSMGKASEVAIPTLLEVFPVNPAEQRKIQWTSKPQHITETIDLGGASVTAPMVRHYYVVKTVEAPAAARALEAITGISLADGGTTKDSWRSALQLQDKRQRPNQSEPEPPEQ